MKIALTGASGHIGANLCRELIGQGHSLRVLVNQYTKSLKGLELEKVDGSLEDPEALDALMELIKQ